MQGKQRMRAGCAVVLALEVLGAWGQMRAVGDRPLTTLSMPVGQSLPVGVQHGLTAGKVQPGAQVEAYTIQRVPVGGGSYLPAGATLSGVVTESARGVGGQPSRLGLRFTALHWHGQTLPVQTMVVALANKAWVDGAGKPVLGASNRGSSGAANWTTEQVGGDALMRSGWSGQLIDGQGKTVGFADFDGVYAFPEKDTSAAGAHAAMLTVPRALGPFSAAAKGPYGYGEEAAVQQGDGGSVVVAPGKLEIRHGDALLLTVVTDGAAAKP